ncbi:MAG: DUF1684 domain-containing protein [Thaumarchaeota archaeon]|nr:DUF1684 domain-containing protein [Nitrososphaerota archaeon]
MAEEQRTVEEWRKEKDKYFMYDFDSPIPHETRHEFKGLSYYPYDPKFRVRATMRKIESDEIIQMVTNKDTNQPYRKFGYLGFTLDGKQCELTAYKRAWVRETDSHLFIPFRDATSGDETYGAGRYIDMEESKEYVIDFNTAYNPFCSYNENYSCPLPPRENWLSVKIKAGEKNFK